MKNTLKTSSSMLLILSSLSLFATISSLSGDEQEFNKQPNDAIPEKGGKLSNKS